MTDGRLEATLTSVVALDHRSSIRPPRKDTKISQRTFGRTILERRRELGLTQKELASRIRRDDDQGAISPQYLNDIEHDRRSPTAHHLIEQLARMLKLDVAYLAYLAGQFPKESSRQRLDEGRFTEAWSAFRRTIEKRKGDQST